MKEAPKQAPEQNPKEALKEAPKDRDAHRALIKAHVEHLSATRPELKTSTIYIYAKRAAAEGKKPPKKPENTTTPPAPLLYNSDALRASKSVSETSYLVPKEALVEYAALPYAPPLFDYAAANSNPVSELASRELCRRRLLPFIKRFRPNYTAGWFHADICRRVERFIERVERKESPRLLLLAPPRCGKSEILSRNTPAWIIGKHPGWELIAASYAGALTMTFSRYIRDLLRDPAYQAMFPSTKLDPSSQSVEAWNTTRGGGYVAVGQGGPITGKGAHCFPAGTKVRTPRGSMLIESIRPGDAIVGYNHFNETVKHTTVKAVRISRRADLVRIITECGREIVATADHPFFTEENGLKCYSYAEILQPGSQLLTCYLSSQMSEKVGQDTVLMVEKLCGDDVEVYDIQVEGTSNFFAEEILVHNCFFIDDIVKDHEAAQSLSQRESTWAWWTSTAYTRLAPGGGVLALMTNWHQDDWAGRIQETMTLGGEVYEVIKYPAINDYGDEYILPDDSIIQIADKEPVPQGALMTRPKNTAIHPERYDTQHMLRIKNNLEMSGQKAVWNALYQQNPVPDEGSFIQKDMFRYYSTAPARRDLYIYQAWDFAISTGKENDYTVGITIGVDHRDAVYVLDMRRFRSGDGIEISQTILEYALEWEATMIGVEDGQIWKAIETQFLKACEEHPSRRYPSYEALKPLTDKKVRADPLRGRMQAGKVYFDKDAHYFTVMQAELLHFPNAKHDDIVDAIAWAVRITLTRTPPQQAKAPQQKSWRDKLNRFMTGAHGATHMSA